jgi:Circadian oscillating protein COP23
MKNKLAILLTGSLLVASAVVLVPARAEDKVNFYCGKSYDPLSKAKIPTTLVSVPGRQEPIALIRWKSEYFAKYTPQQRCNIISPKFQTAYSTGQLKYIAMGQHRRTGQGIVCGLGSKNDTCEDDTNMLFTLKPYTNGQLVLSQLVGIVEGDSNNPIYQNSGGQEILDLRALFKSGR